MSWSCAGGVTNGLVLKVLRDRKSARHETALSRLEMAWATNVPDRRLRAVIQELRGQGYPIYSDPKTKGYRLANNEQEVMELADRFERMGKQHLLTASRLRQRFTRFLPEAAPVQDALF
jgi:biotin operon repressor